MAKSSRGTRAGGPSSPKGLSANNGALEVATAPSVRATDRGMTDAQRTKVLAFEDRYKNAPVEYGMTIDKDGNVWQQKKGNKRSVSWYRYEIPTDGILTHNHPNWEDVSAKSVFYNSVGSPFSMQDLRFAMYYNLAEIRAVTPNYTFSFRRPAGGWPDYKSIEGKTKSIMRRRNKEAEDYYKDSKGKEYSQRIGRVNITIYHPTTEPHKTSRNSRERPIPVQGTNKPTTKYQ